MTLPLLLLACRREGTPPAPTTADTGVAGAGLDGVLTYRTTVDGVTRCDLEVSVRGTPSERACPGCTWVYDVVGTVVEDRSDPECRASPVVTFVPRFGYSRLALAAAPSFLVDWVTPSVTLTDALLSGYDHDGGDYLVTDVYEPLSWDGDPNGGWSLAEELTWTRDGSWDEVESALVGFAPCEDFAYGTSDAHAVGPSVAEDLPCDRVTLDRWSFTGRAGDVVAASVDTVAAATAFTPFLWVNGPEECTLVDGIDDVPCTFDAANPGRSCPAVSLVLPAAGTYVLHVGSDLGCVGSVGAYALTTSGVGALTLVDDDRDAITEIVHHWTESARLTATGP